MMAGLTNEEFEQLLDAGADIEAYCVSCDEHCVVSTEQRADVAPGLELLKKRRQRGKRPACRLSSGASTVALDLPPIGRVASLAGNGQGHRVAVPSQTTSSESSAARRSGLRLRPSVP